MNPSDLQRFVRDALARDELLSGCGCRVSLMDDGNFVSSLEKAMGLGGSGIHAVVTAPTFRPKSNAAKNVVGEIRIRVAVTEVPNLNRKRPGAVGGADAAWHVAWLLNQSFPAGNPGPMLVLDGEIASAVNQAADTVTYSVPFVCINQLLKG